MTRRQTSPARFAQARWLVAAVLLLSSCRSGGWHGAADEACLPSGAEGLAMAPEAMPPAYDTQGLPLPYDVRGPWSPPGLEQPWPADEYLHDGGDREEPVAVSPQWQVEGLNLEDTVAHYDTINCGTLVEASNRVHIYAPRFNSVRTVTHLAVNDQVNQSVGMVSPELAAGHAEVQTPVSSLQRFQARREASALLPGAYLSRQQDGVLSTVLGPGTFQDAFLPFEDLAIIRTGEFDQREKARLAESVAAAVTWSHDDAVRVLLDEQVATEASRSELPAVIFQIKDEGCGKLRLIKVASSQLARPGDTIDFTIRFDNIGPKPIGNVVILDNLTMRLAYVADSAQSSVESRFSVQANEGGSSVLRWEIENPLATGEGGIVRFRCTVR